MPKPKAATTQQSHRTGRAQDSLSHWTLSAMEDQLLGRDGADVGGEEERKGDLEKLEEQVNEMAQKLANYRSTFPDQLKCITARVLAAQRPELPVCDLGSEAGSFGYLGAGLHVAHGTEEVSSFQDHETADKLRLLRDKISRNVSTIPIVLKRLNMCISRIEQLDSNDEIHPAFKRKRS